jgi:hypothetical protein
MTRDTFRREYKALSAEEKAVVDSIKAKADILEKEIEKTAPNRMQALAFTKLEEAVMWAVKAITG